MLKIDVPALVAEQDHYAPISVPTLLADQINNCPYQGILFTAQDYLAGLHVENRLPVVGAQYFLSIVVLLGPDKILSQMLESF